MDSVFDSSPKGRNLLNHQLKFTSQSIDHDLGCLFESGMVHLFASLISLLTVKSDVVYFLSF